MITLRLACLADAQRIQEIYAPYVENTIISFEYVAPTVIEMQKRIKHTLQKYPYIVALDEQRVVGYAYASELKERSAYDHACELSVYVDESALRQGIASKLYKTLFSILKDMHITRVYACLGYPNERSERFHEAYGFKTIGHFTKCGYKFGQWWDMIWMEKSINDDDTSSFIPFSKFTTFKIEDYL